MGEKGEINIISIYIAEWSSGSSPVSYAGGRGFDYLLCNKCTLGLH